MAERRSPIAVKTARRTLVNAETHENPPQPEPRPADQPRHERVRRERSREDGPGRESDTAEPQQDARKFDPHEWARQLKDGVQGRGQLAELLASATTVIVNVDGRSGGVYVSGGSVSGTMIGGDAGVSTGEGARDSGARTAGWSVPNGQPFVPPESYPRALETLQEKKIVVLVAPSGHGKEWLALNLMRAVGCERIEEVDPGLPLRRAIARPRPGTGYLSSHPVVGSLREESPHGLGGLSGELGAVGSCAVVTVAQDSWTVHALDEWVVVLPGGPDPAAVLRAHLLHGVGADRLPAAELAVTELLGTGPVSAALGSGPLPGRVVEMATYLGPVLRGEHALADVVPRLLPDLEEQAAEWLETHRDIGTVTLFLAACVLQGADFVTVARAAAALARRLPSAGNDQASGPEFPSMPRAHRIIAPASMLH
jgi:hypothetical protein